MRRTRCIPPAALGGIVTSAAAACQTLSPAVSAGLKLYRCALSAEEAAAAFKAEKAP